MSAGPAGSSTRDEPDDQRPGAHLVAVAHGTREPAGRAVVGALVADLRRARPRARVRLAFVDVQRPSVAEATAALAGDAAAGVPVVVVPLLLTVGYHVRVDIARAVAGCPGAVCADPLGPDRLLVDLLLTRLREAGANGPVVLAAAGSSDPDAAVAVEQLRQGLADRWPDPVTTGFGASAKPSVAEAVSLAKHAGGPVTVAAYLLGPGHFHGLLSRAGADRVSAPLGPAATLVELAATRFDEALGRA